MLSDHHPAHPVTDDHGDRGISKLELLAGTIAAGLAANAHPEYASISSEAIAVQAVTIAEAVLLACRKERLGLASDVPPMSLDDLGDDVPVCLPPHDEVPIEF